MAGSVRAAKAREHALRQQGVSKAAAAAGAVSGNRKLAKAKKKRSRDAPTCVALSQSLALHSASDRCIDVA